MISALCWLPKDAAKTIPGMAEPTAEEMADEGGPDLDLTPDDDDEEEESEDEEMTEEQQLDHARAVAASLKTEQPSTAPAPAPGSIEAAMAELDMDHYDDDDDAEGSSARIFGSGPPGMAFYRSNALDPYITEPGNEDDDSEADDYAYKPDDLLILAAKNEDDVSHLEIWIYEEADANGPSNMYVHHDIMLPAFPLAVAWLDCDPLGKRSAANLAAVGTMSTGIEIWDLDVVDSVEPIAVLGGEAQEAPKEGEKKKKKKKKKSKPLKEGSHTDAVLGLAWNPEFRNVLASASADRTVKVWDVATQACDQTLTHHSGKVQSVVWNPAEAPVLLTGAFDKNVCIVDVRAGGAAPLRWEISADVEALCWAPHAPTTFLASAEDGEVAAFDARAGGGSAPLYRLSAHDKPACALSFCGAVPGLLATASTDKTVKLWDVSTNVPKTVACEEMKVGALFSAVFSAVRPNLIAAGGANGEVAVWDILSNSNVEAKYGRTLARWASQHSEEPIADAED